MVRKIYDYLFDTWLAPFSLFAMSFAFYMASLFYFPDLYGQAWLSMCTATVFLLIALGYHLYCRRWLRAGVTALVLCIPTAMVANHFLELISL